MSGMDKLSALGDILGVEESEEVVVPSPRRGVGAILGMAPSEVVDRPLAQRRTEPVVNKAKASSSARRPGPTKPGRRVESTVPASPKRRSSATLPLQLVTRIDDARRHRWNIVQLVTAALESLQVDISEAEEVLESQGAGPRVTQNYSLPSVVLQRLDDLGAQWRMNRSQVLTVLLAKQLDGLNDNTDG